MKRWLSETLPPREALLGHRWLRPFAHRLHHPCLWHFNRWSVSRGLALGLFCGFLIPFGQIVIAALFALTVRANLVVAAAATLITNPFTFPAIYYGAYRLGQRLLTTDHWAANAAAAETLAAKSLGWMLHVSAPTALGLFLFASASALFGYLGVQFVWRLWVRRRWAARNSAGA